MSKPKRLKLFSNERFWFIKGAGFLTVGITQSCLDDIGQVETITSLPEEGDELEIDEEFIEIQGSDGDVTVESPVSGVVLEVNNGIRGSLEALNEDPDGEGWLVRIKYNDEEELDAYE